MKKIQYSLIIVLMALLMCPSVHAQEVRDARNRTAATIIADGLAQLPAKDATVFNTVMNEIASTGADGVASLAGMLVPATEGKNATVEYALSGLAAYVTAPGNEALRANVRKGLWKAVAQCNDVTNAAFLISLMQTCGTVEDAEAFQQMGFMNIVPQDKVLQDAAVRAIIGIKGTDDVILNAVKASANKPDAALAYMVEKKQIAAAEPILLGWLANSNAPKGAIYNALAAMGSTASLPVLAKAAKEAGYDGEPTNATQSYFNLLKKLVANGGADGAKLAVKQAKKLWKQDQPANVHGAALEVLTNAMGVDALPYIYKDLKSDCIQVRNAALLNISEYADDNVCASIAAKADKIGPEAVADVLNWFGARGQKSEEEWVASHVTSDKATDAVREAAIHAAGLLGGEKSLAALASQLGTRFDGAATAALSTFKGDANGALAAALAGNADVQKAVLPLVGKRRIAAAKDQVFALLNSDNADVSKAAYAALAGVCRAGDFGRLADLAEKAKDEPRALLQKAMLSAVAAEPADKQYELVSERIGKAADKALYYPLLAQVGNGKAINALMDGYKNGNADAAFDALLKVNNEDVIDKLFSVAADKGRTDAALSRALPLIEAATDEFTNVRKFRLFSEAIDLKPSAAVRNRFLEALGGVPMPSALELAEKFLDDKESAMSAADAVKTIVSKSTEPMGGENVKAALLKAQNVFRAAMATNPDAGYAVDEISGIIEKLPSESVSLISELTPDEKKEGFVMLFDGTNLDQWQGNLDNYTVIDGTIYVDAAYGSGGNLYTKKKYSDFIYRFEFQYMVEGVNNGVGIRTPMNVDAAYEGMEIQILDHDAPIYRGLREYQQHGSVYGIIPAKRVKFGELGTWNTEEIRAIGDHITVTVNGEVILDGNIREACKGHNVAPDGGENTYTVDHQNHPGLFNKDGYISFCGHGTGVKFRNIRIKDMSKKRR